jgi:hypothetical protein
MYEFLWKQHPDWSQRFPAKTILLTVEGLLKAMGINVIKCAYVSLTYNYKFIKLVVLCRFEFEACSEL